jgi:hypothetical protein
MIPARGYHGDLVVVGAAGTQDDPAVPLNLSPGS